MITTADWGIILMMAIVANALAWLFGFEIEIKEKLIVPNVIVLFIIGLMFSLKLMGVE